MFILLTTYFSNLDSKLEELDAHKNSISMSLVPNYFVECKNLGMMSKWALVSQIFVPAKTSKIIRENYSISCASSIKLLTNLES